MSMSASAALLSESSFSLSSELPAFSLIYIATTCEGSSEPETTVNLRLSLLLFSDAVGYSGSIASLCFFFL